MSEEWEGSDSYEEEEEEEEHDEDDEVVGVLPQRTESVTCFHDHAELVDVLKRRHALIKKHYLMICVPTLN